MRVPLSASACASCPTSGVALCPETVRRPALAMSSAPPRLVPDPIRPRREKSLGPMARDRDLFRLDRRGIGAEPLDIELPLDMWILPVSRPARRHSEKLGGNRENMSNSRTYSAT